MPPSGEATVAVSAYRQALDGRARAIGTKRTSAGTRKTELSMKAMEASHASAAGAAAFCNVHSYIVRSAKDLLRATHSLRRRWLFVTDRTRARPLSWRDLQLIANYGSSGICPGTHF